MPVALLISLKCDTLKCILTASIRSSCLVENFPDSIAVSINDLSPCLSDLKTEGLSRVIAPPMEHRQFLTVMMNSDVMHSTGMVVFSSRECGNPD